jgi:phage shock protein C
MIAGVCSGVAEHFGWSATRTRIGYVLLSVLSTGFPGILVYLVLWFILPVGSASPQAKEFSLEDYRVQ